ncbi:MAG TPA: hypothetical protein VHD39_00170 [Acidimicrobiales bacterium]|nr:hypothetical protein [Acidimicrobiales bacterium]
MRSTKRQVTSMAGALVAAALALAACGSSSGPAPSSGSGSASGGAGQSGGAATQVTAPAAVCQKLTGILADGPDADVDPVGSALSHILPLESVHSSNPAVTAAIARLVAADQQLVQASGADKAASSAIKRANSALEKICPGVDQ